MIDRAVHLRPRGDGRPRSLSAFAVAFALSPAKSDRISPSCSRAVGLPAYGLDALLPHLGGERLRTVRIAQPHAARLGGRECRLGALRYLGAFLFGDGRIDVEHERVGVRDLGNDERNALRHTPLRATGDRAWPRQSGIGKAPRPLQRGLQLRPPVECISTLGGLDLGEDLATS